MILFKMFVQIVQNSCTNDTHNLIKICVYNIFKQKLIHNYNDLFMNSLLCKSLCK